MRIATLGPKASFSHEAVCEYSKDDPVFFETIRGVFCNVEQGIIEKGLVPLENSAGGTIGQTLQLLYESNACITDEVVMRINHNLAANTKEKDIKALFVHPQTYLQCESFIDENMKNVKVEYTRSNSESAEKLKGCGKPSGAIVGDAAAKLYRLNILIKNIQDYQNNQTRFVVISEKRNNKHSGKDKSSLFITPKKDEPGLLYKLLSSFASENINLSKIESRPSKDKLGRYVFYLDFFGHEKDANVGRALKDIRKRAKIKFLGSYPRKY